MPRAPLILVCDDERAVRFTVKEALVAAGFDVLEADSAEAALGVLEREPIDVVVTDYVMGAMNGIELTERARELAPGVPVVLLTARGSERIAVEAMKAGAWDYVAKPFAIDDLRLVVARAVETSRLRRTAVTARSGKELVGEALSFRRLLRHVTRVAPRDVTVLLRGETGTGKELLASLLHAESRRASGPCVRFNCAAIPADLAEAELFGWARGAFTGAQAAHRGFFARAHGGTLVLDEVGEMPLAVQAKLLRALQEHEIQPLGATSTEKVDVRVVSCTHKDLAAEVRAGRFREDLYYRLAVVELVVPPLRERLEDVPLLAERFRARYAAEFDLPDAIFTESALAALSRRPWPGNVRELENVVARALALSDGGPIDASAFGGDAAPTRTAPAPGLRAQVDAFERDLVARTLGATNGNQSEAARRLGITRTTLIEKMKRFGLRA
jgi:two-component system response regulator AtoC